ncbi:MAG: flagellar hook-basal body protein [Lachnospiraceae bacterium]|jgi:flagellar basal-body rod protein FlgF|nr:flagellar hook-basal body protein [Lachnospiraceae bacterium]MEE3460983.1 flagellar hook-basal body protein [Lachnospiraceae bacterium]
MVRGLYTAYTGMINEQNRLDVISNNLANSTTVGYKEESTVSQSFKDYLAIKIRDGSNGFVDHSIGTLNPGVKIGETYQNWDQGSLRQTEMPYDLAIAGKGFFNIRVTDKAGNEKIYYGRNGHFARTNEGYLVDKDGNRLQGKGGDIKIPTDAADVAIKRNGDIYADNQLIDKVKISDFEDYNYLKLYGDNFYDTVQGAAEKDPDPDTQIIQGYTEQSNVNVIDEMVQMITVTRAYEAGQKMIQAEDDLNQQAANKVGAVGS